MKTLQIASTNSEFFTEQVRKLEELGIDCDVIYATSRSSDNHKSSSRTINKIYNSIYGHNLPYYVTRSATFHPKLIAEIRKNDYDVIHVNSGMVAPFGLLQPQRPVVTTLWGDDLLGNRLYGCVPKITKYCASKSDSVFVRSKEMKKELDCEATILPSGVDMDKFRPIDNMKAKEKLGWDNKTSVLFPYPKSQDKKRYPLARKIVNKANRKSEYDIVLKQVSGVPHENMYVYYSAADVLLLPSLREGSPNTVKEAMACNLPVVTTDVGDVKKRLSNTNPSAVCQNDNQLAGELISVISKQSRSNGRGNVNEVGWENIAQKIKLEYEKIQRE